MNVLQINNVSKTIDGVTVLKHVSVEFHSGKIYGIVGRNGSGKTMLLRVIAGLIRPSEGQVRADDGILHQDFAVFPSVGIVIENAGLYPEFTGLQNLKFLAEIRGRIGEKEIRDAITKVGLDPDDRRPLRKYSLGMRQRIVLAQAIMERPKLLLLDEPGNALDKSGIAMLKKLVMEAKAAGAIVLMSSHDSEIISEVCDEVYQMEEGELTV